MDGGDGISCDWADWIAPRLVGGGRTWKLAEAPRLVADAQWGSVQAGRNCDGGPLRAGGVETEDGIGTHALSRIAFAVPEGVERFQAQAGPDETGVAQGCGTSLVFQVRRRRRRSGRRACSRTTRRTRRMQPCSENPLGEWNRCDILLDGPRLELRVNGVLQNTADWCEEMPGYIALQSEGAAIELRDVRLRPILR